MKTAVIHFIILGVVSGLTSGVGVLPDGPLPAAVGDTVMFTTTLSPPENPFQIVTWTFIEKVVEKPIITSTSINNTAPEYGGRITLFRSTGTLELRHLVPNDSGVYRVTITPDVGAPMIGQTILEILVAVSNVTVTSSDTDLVEFNSFISLTCSSSGSSLSFLWLNGSSEVTSGERVELTNGGRNLTILNVTQHDRGPFRCHVFNHVSNGTSDPVNLSISYGPQNVNILGPTILEGKQTLILFCFAESTPSATYTWLLDGHEILSNSAVLINLMADSGKYTCQARNDVTGRTSSGEHTLIVHAPGRLSAGDIAAIVLACVVVVGGALAGGIYIYKTKRNNSSRSPTAPPSSVQQEMPNRSIRPGNNKREEERQYETIKPIYETKIVNNFP